MTLGQILAVGIYAALHLTALWGIRITLWSILVELRRRPF